MLLSPGTSCCCSKPCARQAAGVPSATVCLTLFKQLLLVQDLLGMQVDDAPLQAVCQSNLISLQCSSGSLHQKKWLSAAIRKLEAYLDKVSIAWVQLG